MPARSKRNPYATRLADAAKRIAKARAHKLHAPLFDAFVVFAAAGDVARVSTVLDWMYGVRTPRPTSVATALSTSAMDGFCQAAELGDRTGGVPLHDVPERPLTSGGSLATRVADAEVAVRARLTVAAYSGNLPRDDAWERRDRNDPWRAIDRWRRIQAFVAAGEEEEALARLVDLLEELDPNNRGAGYGGELVLAIDLALRLGEGARIPGWLARHGQRFADESFLIETALCLPAVATAITHGTLRGTVGLSESDLASALEAIDEAIEASVTTAPKPIAKVQRRRASCEYSQVHLRPETLDEAELALVHFQRPGDSESGVSLFPTTVGIATPTDTDYVDAEITVLHEAPPSIEGVAQAVTFPLLVRGPLVLASATSADDEPFGVPPGSYDVVARFVPKSAPKASKKAGLRVFTLLLGFHPR